MTTLMEIARLRAEREVRAVEITALRTRLAEATAIVAAWVNDDYDHSRDSRTDVCLAREGYTQCAACARWLAPGAACPDCQEVARG